MNGLRIKSGDEVLDFKFDGSENNLPGNVYREEFDFFLTQEAAESGSKIIDSTRVIKIVIPEKEEKKCCVVTEKGREECEIILGADGANSIVRRALGISYPRSRLAVAIEAEVPGDEEVFEFYDDKNFYDLGYVQRGYAWAFPKREGETINVGLIVLAEEAKKMNKPLLTVWKEFLTSLEWAKNRSVHPHGTMLPYQGTVDRLGHEKTLLLGDAAGFVEPVGGEGIPYAIDSSLNAAEAVKLYFEGRAPLLDAYNDLMKDTLDEINIYGMKMHNNFFVKNRIKTFLKMTRKNKDMFNVMRKMMSRSISYKQALESFSLPKFILAYIKTMF